MTMRIRFFVAGLALAAASTPSAAQTKPVPPDTAPKLLPAPAKAAPPRPGMRAVAPDPSSGFQSRPLAAPDTGLSGRLPAPKAAVHPAPPAPAQVAPPPPPSPNAAVSVDVRANNVRFSQLEAPPVNATGRCKDGTWLFGAITENSCAAYGGGPAALLPKPSVPPPAPRRP